MSQRQNSESAGLLLIYCPQLQDASRRTRVLWCLDPEGRRLDPIRLQWMRLQNDPVFPRRNV